MRTWFMVEIVTILTLFVYFSDSAKLPSYIIPCSSKDPKLNECAKTNGQLAIPGLLKGDVKYRIPNMLPLKLSFLSFEPSNNLKITIQNAEIFGFENSDILKANMDLENKHLIFDVFLPKAVLIGEYIIKGRLLFLPIEGQGRTNITFVNGTYSYELNFSIKNKNGLEYIEIITNKLTYETRRAYYHLENLFNGNKLLGEQMNKFLNENWKDVNDIIGTTLSETISHIITTILKALFENVPYKNFFID